MHPTGNRIMTDGEEGTSQPCIFLPSRRLKFLYLTRLFFIVWVVVMPAVMVICIGFPTSVSLPISVAALLVVLLALTWIRRYYGSIRYHFTTGHITGYHGVLFKKTTCIPCDQVHRVSTRKGPFQRLFGIATVDLLTTDPTAPCGSRVHLSIFGNVLVIHT